LVTAQQGFVRCTRAVEVLEPQLGHLPHPEGGVLRLAQFSYATPAVLRVRRQICEALVKVLEDAGARITFPDDDGE